jgi:hypothetical protein
MLLINEVGMERYKRTELPSVSSIQRVRIRRILLLQFGNNSREAIPPINVGLNHGRIELTVWRISDPASSSSPLLIAIDIDRDISIIELMIRDKTKLR